MYNQIFTKGQSRMDNSEKLETLGTQDTERRQIKDISLSNKKMKHLKASINDSKNRLEFVVVPIQ
jgi:hypothetical protein